MEINEYVKLASVTRAELGTILNDNIHMVLGILTEGGELADVFKKAFAYKKQIDWTNVKEEIGDIMWYIAGICDVNGFDLEKILETNIAKLKTRYPDKYNDENAINRDLDKERKVLENG